MHALRRIHEVLVPEGILLDMHPVPPSTRAEVRGESLGEFDDAEFMELVATAEAKFEGLFTVDAELEFDYRERHDDPAELIEMVKTDWDGCHIPAALEARILEADPPVYLWERVVLRRFRANRNRG